jgi:GT2 family glycosyltransferase
MLRNRLAAPLPQDGLDLQELVDAPPVEYSGAMPSMTVAVCTRDRTGDLKRCLDSLVNVDYPALDLLVVDNAPSNDATERLVRGSYPNVRYICEPRPGLDWARNRAIAEAGSDIIAYTDDDAVADPGWASALARVFAEHPEVMAVTGLVVPYELETGAQILFESYGGFGRGFSRGWYRLDRDSGKDWFHIGAGRFGTGANMAFRRSVFEHIGSFDPALDVGTVTNGGGDLEMFFRVLQEEYTLVYEPNAIIRHRHRRSYEELRTQLRNHGIGLYSYFVCSAMAYPEMRLAFIRFGLWWLWHWDIRRLLISFVRPARMPRYLILAELYGAFIGLTRYRKARKVAASIKHNYGTSSRKDNVGYSQSMAKAK